MIFLMIKMVMMNIMTSSMCFSGYQCLLRGISISISIKSLIITMIKIVVSSSLYHHHDCPDDEYHDEQHVF